jgi:hypothetical protein
MKKKTSKKKAPKDDSQAMQRARRAKKSGKSASTQAGSFVHEEMDHAKKGKHKVKSRKQAIAIGLSKARQHGIHVKGKTKKRA